MLKHRLNLPPCNSWEPFQKLVHGGAILQVLEER